MVIRQALTLLLARDDAKIAQILRKLSTSPGKSPGEAAIPEG
jgi:hypothetical protein